MRKSLKIGLIILILILGTGGIRAGGTKTGLIPNWFDIEQLYPNNDTCLCMCKFLPIIGCSCNSRCEKPKYDSCINKCEKPNIEGYSKKDYDNRYSLKHDGKNVWNDSTRMIYSTLNGLQYYDEWINEMFDGHQEELKSYEECKFSCGPDPSNMIAAKPIIYLYPSSKIEVHIKLGNPENLYHTYPKYNSREGRNVTAEPDGHLEDIETGRKFYALYREGKSKNESNFDEGFVIKGKDIIPFLEEKLAILGLNERESEEFIVYRLPQMEHKERILIRFESIEEQDENMPLNITPTPDTVIRVMMDWKAIDEPIDIPEQQLSTPERNGFTVVERGGSPRI